MRIGIDLGGTKISAVAIDHDGNLRVPQRSATPGNYADTLQIIEGLVADIEDELGAPASVGIGTPGAKNPETGLFIGAENTPLEGKAFVEDISRQLSRPVRVANDANCFALSEAVDGAAAGRDVVVGLILGTGAGAGIVIHGRPLAGLRGVAGEWGHNPLPWPVGDELDQVTCYCGKRGCIEMFISGTGLARDHKYVTGEELKGAQIMERAKAGDAKAAATMERFYDRVTRSTATVINFLDPDAIVFGGGVSACQDIYTELPKRLSPYLFMAESRVHIAPSQHGADSGVRGAAWLWPQDEWSQGLPARKN